MTTVRTIEMSEEMKFGRSVKMVEVRDDRIQQMKELIAVLLPAARAYYQESREIMSNLEYDRLYDELLKLESETGIILAGGV